MGDGWSGRLEERPREPSSLDPHAQTSTKAGGGDNDKTSEDADEDGEEEAWGDLDSIIPSSCSSHPSIAS